MNTNKKMWVALTMFSATVVSTSTQAAVLTFGGAVANQVSVDTNTSIAAGLTSSVPGYINAATNTVTGANVYLETFDAKATGLNGIGAPTRPTTGPNTAEIQYGGPNGGFMTLNPNLGGDL